MKRLQRSQDTIQLAEALLEYLRLMWESLRERISWTLTFMLMCAITKENSINVLTSMDLQTPATAWQAADVGKSMGKLGRPRIETRGSSPFWFTNSWQWSSVVLLLSMDSTNFIWQTYASLIKEWTENWDEHCLIACNTQHYTQNNAKTFQEALPHSEYNPLAEWVSSPQCPPPCKKTNIIKMKTSNLSIRYLADGLEK